MKSMHWLNISLTKNIFAGSAATIYKSSEEVQFDELDM